MHKVLLLVVTIGLATLSGRAAPVRSERAVNQGAVTLSEDAETYLLFNGILAARIEKSSGNLLSLHYQGLELLGGSRANSSGGYWNLIGRCSPGTNATASVRINPATNSGARAEISCRLFNNPNAPESPLDADYRYSLGRGEHWLYVYSVLEHKPGYPVLSVQEARYCLKLNPNVFDYLNIDGQRRRVMPSGYDWDHGTPLNLSEARRMTTGIHKGEVEHKYDYSAVLVDTPAYGWLSTQQRLGLWMINPNTEYLGGGPTKVELTGHLDSNKGGLAVLLNMWAGSHYGGTVLSAAADEQWSKMVGPFVLYCNAASLQGGDSMIERAREVLWQDALSHATSEAGAWPYTWMSDSNYPPASRRGALNGEIVLNELFAPNLKVSNMWVGVSAPDWRPAKRSGLMGMDGFSEAVDWQRDAKFYQFWARADTKGRFTLEHVRPGAYTLHAFAAGVLGEFVRSNIVVAPGENRALGRLEWTPTRFGRTLWEIGVPDRTAREFRHGDHFWQWGLYFDYAKEFPNDVNFQIGSSDWRKDWNYVQPPHLLSRDLAMNGEDNENNDNAAQALASSPRRTADSSTWSILFNLAKPVSGKATLRLAFCGARNGCDVSVEVNGKSVGNTGPLPPTGTMHRDGITGYWIEKDVSFDAALFQQGENRIRLISRASNWTQGVLYDYLRLELNDAAR